MDRYPYERLINYLISQGFSPHAIRQTFVNKHPFIPPTHEEIKRRTLDVLETAREYKMLPYDNKKPVSINDIPGNQDRPPVLECNEDSKALAKELNVYEFWSAMISDQSITGADSEMVEHYQKAWNIFSNTTKPKTDLCIIKVDRTFDNEQIVNLMNEKFYLDIDEKVLDAFEEYIWDVNGMGWTELDEYASRYSQMDKSEEQYVRGMRWAMDQKGIKMAFVLGYNVASLDIERMMEEIITGEYMHILEDLRGWKELDPYDRNKMISTARQAVLVAKGYKDATGGDSPDDNETKRVNSDDQPLDGYRRADNFEDRTLKPGEPDEENTEEENNEQSKVNDTK